METCQGERGGETPGSKERRFSPFSPDPGTDSAPNLAGGARGGGRGAGGAPGAVAFPASVPLPPAAVPPTPLSRPLTSRPGRRDPGRRGRGEEAPRHREGGGRARSPSPELQNSPAASPRAPARPSVQPPAPGEWGSPSPGGARGARDHVAGLRAACARGAGREPPHPRDRGGSPPWVGRAGRGRGPSVPKSHWSSARRPGRGLPPHPTAPSSPRTPNSTSPPPDCFLRLLRRGGREKFGEESGRLPSPWPTALPGLSESRAVPCRRKVSGASAHRAPPHRAGGTGCAQAGVVGSPPRPRRRLRCAPQRRGATSLGLERWGSLEAPLG